jgi:hypothetical protein
MAYVDDGRLRRRCLYLNPHLWNGQIGENRPLIQWGLPGLFSRVFVTPDDAVSVFNDTAGLARTGAGEVLVELAELFRNSASLTWLRSQSLKTKPMIVRSRFKKNQNASECENDIAAFEPKRQGTAIPGKPR